MAKKSGRRRTQDRAGVAGGQDCELRYESNSGRSRTTVPRTLFLGTRMFAFLSSNVCWAQSEADEPPSRLQNRYFGGTTLARPGSIALSLVRGKRQQRQII
jgi:hypothetical protein